MIKDLVLGFSVFLMAVSPVLSCRRAAGFQFPTLQESFESASLVFEGEVLSNNESDKPGNNGVFWSTKANFRIHKIWKGKLEKGNEFEVYLQKSSCDRLGYAAQRGAHFVIFAYPYYEKPGMGISSEWSAGFDSGSFELTSYLDSTTKESDGEKIGALEEIAGQTSGSKGKAKKTAEEWLADVNAEDGVSLVEATRIANAYFQLHVGCGNFSGISEKDDAWGVEGRFGLGAAPIRDFLIDKNTGAIKSTVGPSYDHPIDMLKFTHEPMPMGGAK